MRPICISLVKVWQGKRISRAVGSSPHWHFKDHQNTVVGLKTPEILRQTHRSWIVLALGPGLLGVQYSALMLKLPEKFWNLGLIAAGSRYVAALAKAVAAYPSGNGYGNGGTICVTFATATVTKNDLQL
jgi:hypothetical protein